MPVPTFTSGCLLEKTYHVYVHYTSTGIRHRTGNLRFTTIMGGVTLDLLIRLYTIYHERGAKKRNPKSTDRCNTAYKKGSARIKEYLLIGLFALGRVESAHTSGFTTKSAPTIYNQYKVSITQ